MVAEYVSLIERLTTKQQKVEGMIKHVYMYALYVLHDKGVYVSCVCAVDEGDLFNGEVHPIPCGSEEGCREAQVHHVDHVCKR